MHPISLLLLALLLCITTSTVYYVIPDNHYHPINDNTYTLQHYLNNTNKYFTSNTQLHFLPGQYYLNNDLMIQGVSNFTLIGNRINEVINTVINCTSPAGIVVVGSSNIVIANIVMNGCGKKYKFYIKHTVYFTSGSLVSVYTLDCKFINYTNFHIFCHPLSCGFQLVNVFKQMFLLNLIASFIMIRNDNLTTNTDHIVHITDFQAYNVKDNIYLIQIDQYYTTSDFAVTIVGVNFTGFWNLLMLHIGCTGHNLLNISDCTFTSKYQKMTDDIDDYEDNEKNYYFNASSSTVMYNNDFFDKVNGRRMVYTYYENCDGNTKPNKIYINHCYIINSTEKSNGNFKLLHFVSKKTYNEKVRDLSVDIIGCMFINNQNIGIILAVEYHNDDDQSLCVSTFIKDTIITNSTVINEVIYTHKVKLYLTNLTISNIYLLYYGGKIIDTQEGYLIFHSYNVILNTSANSAIFAPMIYIQEHTTLQLTLNSFKSPALNSYKHYHYTDTIKRCIIQYISKRGNLDKEFQMGKKLNYSIIFTKNNMPGLSNAVSLHCSWESSSAFQSSRPLHVNRRFISSDKEFTKSTDKTVCLCNNKLISCKIEEMSYFYPGQNVSISFGLNPNHTFPRVARIRTRDDSRFACKPDVITIFELTPKQCINTSLTLKHRSGKWCELCLKTQPLDSLSAETGNYWIEIYTIIFRACPKGFSLYSEGYCQCDIILSSHIPSLTHCNIDDQTIPRPANSWISAHTVNNSHSYHVSLHCPFDYCLPHSSHLNLSTPDSQCQFNRSGLLCGQCQQGLSAVFGSSQCKKCSRIFLLLLVGIGIAGLLLVLLLFLLNLTVTDGNINPFLLSVNIIGINISTIFPTNKLIVHTFISLANLDLGIETCFYDRMDEYAKRWLQLAFPAYLICIATVIIISSRYSTRIQRLTARRALPVLATLFLLSYTKVLLTVSNVLFSYSTITSLPSNRTITVWSVDTSVSLFGFKFTTLFIACLLLFIVLIPFNIVLIFTRALSYFKIVTYFKPLIDAYQGPYKIKYYYWSGLQLLMRAIFFGLSALERDKNLMISTILFAVILCLQKVFPFTNKINNIMEMLSLLNLHVIFVIAYFMTTNDIMINAAVSLVIIQLMLIILMHMKILFCKDTNFTEIVATKFDKWISCFRGQQSQRRPIELADVVPEVKYNYKEFREPLIGRD